MIDKCTKWPISSDPPELTEAWESRVSASSSHSAADKCFSVSLPLFSAAGTAAPEWALSCTRLNPQWVHFQFAHSKVVIILWPTNWNFLLIPHHFSCSPFELRKKAAYIYSTHICESLAGAGEFSEPHTHSVTLSLPWINSASSPFKAQSTLI